MTRILVGYSVWNKNPEGSQCVALGCEQRLDARRRGFVRADVKNHGDITFA
jgi:hypothetical protein